MHNPRCLDPKTQTGEHPFPYEGGCYLGRPGHCVKCPHRGQSDPRHNFLARVGGHAPSALDLDESSYTRRPDTLFPGGKTMPEEIANFLWPPSEREWIERQGRWAERAGYHYAMAQQFLISELLREVHDLKAALTAAQEGEER